MEDGKQISVRFIIEVREDKFRTEDISAIIGVKPSNDIDAPFKISIVLNNGIAFSYTFKTKEEAEIMFSELYKEWSMFNFIRFQNQQSKISISEQPYNEKKVIDLVHAKRLPPFDR